VGGRVYYYTYLAKNPTNLAAYYLQKYLAKLGPLLGLTLLFYLLRCNQSGCLVWGQLLFAFICLKWQKRAFIWFFLEKLGFGLCLP